jgi:hypothetical protein
LALSAEVSKIELRKELALGMVPMHIQGTFTDDPSCCNCSYVFRVDLGLVPRCADTDLLIASAVSPQSTVVLLVCNYEALLQ